MNDCYDSKHRSNIMNLQQCGPIPSNTRRCHARSGSISPSAQSAEPSTSSTHQYAPPRVAMHNIKFNTTDVPGVFHWGRICSQKLAGLEPASHVSEVVFAGMQHHPAQERLEALLIGDRSLTLAISSASRATPTSFDSSSRSFTPGSHFNVVYLATLSSMQSLSLVCRRSRRRMT
jgi:hypothetical protein